MIFSLEHVRKSRQLRFHCSLCTIPIKISHPGVAAPAHGNIENVISGFGNLVISIIPHAHGVAADLPHAICIIRSHRGVHVAQDTLLSGAINMPAPR